VIRIGDGGLILHSPGPLTPELRRELDALGRVAYVVVPKAHGRFAAEASRSYPEARVLAAPEPSRRRASLAFHGSLADSPPAAWQGRVESHRVRGFRLQEVVLFHRPSRTLVLTDLCFHVRRSPSAVARGFFRANGVWQRFGPSRLIRRLAVSDHAALQGSIDHILGWDFERIVPGHGDVLEHGGRDALRKAWPP
jgi:hypothetical protein